MFLVFSFSVSCCHSKVPKISHFADHPFQVESAFFIVHEVRGGEGGIFAPGELIGVNTGSGAVVSSGTGYSDIITAGHLCNLPEEFLGFESNFIVFDHAGNYYGAKLTSINIKLDLCMLRIDYEKKALSMASISPNQGSKVFMAGFPMGAYHPNYMHFFDGYYSGTDYGGNAIWTFPAAPGSSGGVVVNVYGEIVGVVSAVYNDFSHLTIGPGVEHVDSFIKKSKSCTAEKPCLLD